jgi:hypothetical protein
VQSVSPKAPITRTSSDAAEPVEQAAQARFDTGLATRPELLQAQQQSAQSNFDLQASLGAESDARVALTESIGLMPNVSLKVADLPEKRAANVQTEDAVGELISKALSQRPDLVAKLANVRSKEQEILKVRAENIQKSRWMPMLLKPSWMSESQTPTSSFTASFRDTRPTQISITFVIGLLESSLA